MIAEGSCSRLTASRSPSPRLRIPETPTDCSGRRSVTASQSDSADPHDALVLRISWTPPRRARTPLGWLFGFALESSPALIRLSPPSPSTLKDKHHD